MLLLRSNGTLLHMKDCIITFVKLIISKKHNFILYNALTNTDLQSNKCIALQTELYHPTANPSSHAHAFPALLAARK